MFVRAHHTIYSIPAAPLLQVALSAGFAVLKTPSCHGRHIATDDSANMPPSGSLCPICSPELNTLAQSVPFAHAVRSSLVDALSGEPIDGNNELIALPNGRVYNFQSLIDWNQKARARDGFVLDPLTGIEHRRDRLRKVFMM